MTAYLVTCAIVFAGRPVKQTYQAFATQREASMWIAQRPLSDLVRYTISTRNIHVTTVNGEETTEAL